ncbi:uncharacterized protein LOC143916408 [Arctopsyche grandis]|uniref:uncharacterized protein LOC143916408 n=1 Tax=Arctopsyche grandis TaxID=121162 RepID=UPI00406D706C
MEEPDFPRKVFLNKLNGSSLKNVWICGIIEQNVGTDILIVKDPFARAKITGCNSAQQERDSSWIQKGSHCSVIGTLMNNKGLPEIRACKIVNVTNDEVAQTNWATEVECLDLFLERKVEPALEP